MYRHRRFLAGALVALALLSGGVAIYLSEPTFNPQPDPPGVAFNPQPDPPGLTSFPPGPTKTASITRMVTVARPTAA